VKNCFSFVNCASEIVGMDMFASNKSPMAEEGDVELRVAHFKTSCDLTSFVVNHSLMSAGSQKGCRRLDESFHWATDENVKKEECHDPSIRIEHDLRKNMGKMREEKKVERLEQLNNAKAKKWRTRVLRCMDSIIPKADIFWVATMISMWMSPTMTKES